MNIAALSFIFIAITSAMLGFFMLTTKSGNKRVSNIWGYFCVNVLPWGIGGLIGTTATSKETAYLGWQIANICSIFTPVMFFHFITALFNLNVRIILRILYFLGAVFLSVNFFARRSFLGDLRLVFDQYYYISYDHQTNFIYLVFYIAFYWFVLLAAFSILIWKFIPSKGVKRNQIKYLILGSMLGWTGAHGDFLSVFKYDIYPYANFLIAIYPIPFTYAILRYQLMDFNIIIKKGIIYSTLITAITCLYLISVRASEQFFQNFLGYSSVWGSMSITLVIAVLFNPLKNRIQDFVDRIIFKGTTAEIAKQNERLRLQVTQAERYKTMADLTSGIIKEIANPLKALKESDSDLDRNASDPAFMQTYARREQQEIEKINSLLEHLTDYSNPAQATMQETNIHKLINETTGMLKSALAEKNIKLIKEFQAPEDMELKIDASQIRQALSNTIANAVEAMPEGGKLHMVTEIADGVFRMVVRDSGSGIAKEDIEKIFDPFFTRKVGHTGLGLSVTRGIIENHQGKIRVRSEAGFLTEFIMELPLPVQPVVV